MSNLTKFVNGAVKVIVQRRKKGTFLFRIENKGKLNNGVKW